ncbi:MAG: hypothetical protein Q4D07_10125 [Selenomonadaceae bacterium]|nr:hypothetical protein [Selenomonadaceae bacterium]
MEVIALVGQSGTGKSHRALMVANEYQADAIIDDGILIRDGKIIAGKSAKHEKSKIMAVRRAIFVLPGHAEEVGEALREDMPNRILIIGTSDNMVGKIAKKLGLPPISRVVRIEDVATPEEMEKAHEIRMKKGMHIIPVPSIELAPHFSGYLIDPIRSLFNGGKKRRRLGEKSIVRPIFSYYGKLIIDDRAVSDIVRILISSNESVRKVSDIKVEQITEDDEHRGLVISCSVVLAVYGKNIPQLMAAIQNETKKQLELQTGMVVRKLDVNVRALVVGAK